MGVKEGPFCRVCVGPTVALGRYERAIIGPFSDSASISTGDMPSKGVVPLVYSL
jgi:hypothetical protein